MNRPRLRSRASQLRIYNGPADDSPTMDLLEAPKAAETISVALAEVLPLLVDAVQSERTWLRDFAADPITIPADLYEVILAYQHYRRPSA
jgi:hypothetical protein